MLKRFELANDTARFSFRSRSYIQSLREVSVNNGYVWNNNYGFNLIFRHMGRYTSIREN